MTFEPEFDPNAAIGAIRAGDADAFRSLIDQYQRMVIAYFAGALSDDALVEELTQDTFVTAYEKLAQYQDKGFPSWLMAIARSKLLMHLRSKQRRANALDRLRHEITVSTQDHAERFDHEVTRRQINQLHQCLQQLPEQTARLIRTCYLEGATVKELAVELGRSEDSVRSALFRARRQLRTCMLTI
jgi:RNA polymerase sigma-70 factor (ECF subfamily)